MKHNMWYDNEHQVLILEFVDDYLRSDIEPIYNKIMAMLEEKPYRQLLIILSGTHKVENRETREISNQMLIKANISELAFVGGSAANRMIAKVLIKTGIVKSKGNFFKNENEAINWLKNNR